MALTLTDVVQSIQEGNLQQEITTKSIDDLTTVFERYFKAEKNKKGDLLEAARERKSGSTAGGIKAMVQQNKEDTSGFGIPALSPLLLALGAWAADLDSYLRALRPDVLLKPVVKFFKLLKGTFGRLTSFVSDISKIRLPDIKLSLPRIGFIDAAGKAITDFIDYKIKLPVINFIDGAGKAITDFIDYKIKLPGLRLLDAAGKAVDDFKISMPEGVKSFFTRISDFFQSIKAYNTTVGEKLVLPEGVRNFFSKVGGFFSGIAEWFKGIEASIDLKPFLDPIKNAFGFAGEGDTPGKGLLGFFGKLKDFLGVILKPVGVATRILGGPFVQGFLSLLDFIKGFKDAFSTQETVYDEFGNAIEDTRGLGSKIMDGLEGGVKGVIKGIVDAIDLLFLDLPGWILEKLGFENVGKFLKDLNIGEMVDPVWNWVKSIPQMLMDMVPSAEQMKQFVINTISGLPGGYYVLKAMGIGGAELDVAKKNADIEAATSQIAEEQARIDRSKAGENEYTGYEDKGRASSQQTIRELTAEIEQMRRERDEAAAAAGIVVSAPVTTTDASTNVQNNTVGSGDTVNPHDTGAAIADLP